MIADIFCSELSVRLRKMHQLATDNNINFSHRSILIYQAMLEQFDFNPISEETITTQDNNFCCN